jgi:hypothetical protein
MTIFRYYDKIANCFVLNVTRILFGDLEITTPVQLGKAILFNAIKMEVQVVGLPLKIISAKINEVCNVGYPKPGSLTLHLTFSPDDEYTVSGNLPLDFIKKGNEVIFQRCNDTILTTLIFGPPVHVSMVSEEKYDEMAIYGGYPEGVEEALGREVDAHYRNR